MDLERKRRKEEKLKLKELKVQQSAAKGLRGWKPGKRKGFEKKRQSSTIASAYSPSEVENSWYSWWEESRLFKVNPSSDKPKFSMLIPPPNVTGKLHIMCAVQDVVARHRRMRGFETLWVPGVDHGGIATQVVVERSLAKDGVSRRNQFRKMGASVDWSRDYFTMDHHRSKAVVEAFVRLHEDGLVTRSDRLVNWDCSLKTAVSVSEVNPLEVAAGEALKVPGYDKPVMFGTMHIPVEGGREIVVASTRPETIFGDTAVAVHPEDRRYTMYHGKFVVLLFSGNKLLNMDAGTGAVKITPGHDHKDFSCGKRQQLQFINVLTDDGKINSHGGEFQGLNRYDARAAVVEALKLKGLYRGSKGQTVQIGEVSRSGDVVEPVMKPQWYVDCSALHRKALDAARGSTLEILPAQFTEMWSRILASDINWCVSRQLWWGHRIPAWYATLDGDEDTTLGAYDAVSRTEEDARTVVEQRFPGVSFTLAQDPDVLDTWFSSALALGWPDETQEETAEEERATGYLKTEFATGIPECGVDSLRFGLIAYTVQPETVLLDVKRIVGYRHWCNKLWNAVRYALLRLGDDFQPSPAPLEASELPWCCQWILSTLNSTVARTNACLDSYNLYGASCAVYAWWQHQLCDVLIKLTKPLLREEQEGGAASTAVRDTLWLCLEIGLRLLHPFMPFITEELWQRINRSECPSIMLASYPAGNQNWENPQVEEEMRLVVGGIRRFLVLKPAQKTSLGHVSAFGCLHACRLSCFLLSTDPAVAAVLGKRLQDVSALASVKVETVEAVLVDDSLSAYIRLSEEWDARRELQALRRQQDTDCKRMESPRSSVANSKVPEPIRAKAQKLEAEHEARNDRINWVELYQSAGDTFFMDIVARCSMKDLNTWRSVSKIWRNTLLETTILRSWSEHHRRLPQVLFTSRGVPAVWFPTTGETCKITWTSFMGTGMQLFATCGSLWCWGVHCSGAIVGDAGCFSPAGKPTEDKYITLELFVGDFGGGTSLPLLRVKRPNTQDFKIYSKLAWASGSFVLGLVTRSWIAICHERRGWTVLDRPEKDEAGEHGTVSLSLDVMDEFQMVTHARVRGTWRASLYNIVDGCCETWNVIPVLPDTDGWLFLYRSRLHCISRQPLLSIKVLNNGEWVEVGSHTGRYLKVEIPLVIVQSPLGFAAFDLDKYTWASSPQVPDVKTMLYKTMRPVERPFRVTARDRVGGSC